MACHALDVALLKRVRGCNRQQGAISVEVEGCHTARHEGNRDSKAVSKVLTHTHTTLNFLPLTTAQTLVGAPGGVLLELPNTATVLCVPRADNTIAAPSGERAEAWVKGDGVDGEDVLHLSNLATMALEGKLFGIRLCSNIQVLYSHPALNASDGETYRSTKKVTEGGVGEKKGQVGTTAQPNTMYRPIEIVSNCKASPHTRCAPHADTHSPVPSKNDRMHRV
jgi:hypothetical protein